MVIQEGLVNRVTVVMALACIALEFGCYIAIYRQEISNLNWI